MQVRRRRRGEIWGKRLPRLLGRGPSSPVQKDAEPLAVPSHHWLDKFLDNFYEMEKLRVSDAELVSKRALFI